MTEQQRREIRAELARRMGWQDIESCKNWDFTFSPSGLPPGQKEYKNIPDPFTSAADNRELVEWLAADDALWLPFKKELRLEWIASTSSHAANLEYERWLLTLPREAITLAAARALGLQEAGDE